MVAVLIAACGAAQSGLPAGEAHTVAPPLARPHVTMVADPAPPFTYWAPEGAEIRNHPNVPGIWIAYVNGRNTATYFGDRCQASRFQQFVGAPLASMPAPQAEVELRQSCSTCAVNDDLRPNRINVIFDEETRRIEKIACY